MPPPSNLDDIDIAFADAGGNWLPFEIDTWNTSGESLVWVLLPSLSQGVQFQMYWGGETSGKSLNDNNPWSDYAGVWHLGETGAGGTSANSSPYGSALDATNHANTVASVGKIGGARRISDAERQNNHKVGGLVVDGTQECTKFDGTFTIAGWFYHKDQQVRYDHLFYKRNVNKDTTGGIAIEMPEANDTQLNIAGNGGKSSTAIVPNVRAVWNHFAFVFDNTTCTVYTNGASASSVSIYKATDNSLAWAFGNDSDRNDNTWKGSIDEVRLRGFVPTADWMAADYATQSDPSFLTAGAAESIVETADPQIAVSVPASGISYVDATVNVIVQNIGAGAREAEVEVVVSASSDYANPVWTANYSVTAADTRYLAVAGLSYGTTYYVKATVTCDAAGANPVVKTASFTTLIPGSPSATAAFVESGFTTLSASVSVSDFGTGAESATVWLEASQTDDFASVVASDEVSAALDGTSAIVFRGLSPGTAYNLRAAISNDWGLVKYVALPAASTRSVPFATTGIGWTFSNDGSAIDFTFGVSGIYDGATGSASLTYNGVPCGAIGFSEAGTLTWPGVTVASGKATATVVLSATLDGQTYSQTFTATFSRRRVRASSASTASGWTVRRTRSLSSSCRRRSETATSTFSRMNPSETAGDTGTTPRSGKGSEAKQTTPGLAIPTISRLWPTTRTRVSSSTRATAT